MKNYSRVFYSIDMILLRAFSRMPLVLISSLIFTSSAAAQQPQYLFTVETRQPVWGEWMVNSHTAYGVRITGPIGSDGFEESVGIQLGFSRRLSLIASGGVLINRQSEYEGGGVSTELVGRILSAGGGSPVEISLGGGFSRDYGGVEAVSARLLAGRSFGKWNMASNAYFEKGFDSLRDKVDIAAMLGISRELFPWMRGGVEIIAEDIEGFWEEEEAEGGAKMFMGPALHISGITRNIFVTLGGGMVVYLTESSVSSQAIPLMPAVPVKDGYVVRVNMTYVM